MWWAHPSVCCAPAGGQGVATLKVYFLGEMSHTLVFSYLCLDSHIHSLMNFCRLPIKQEPRAGPRGGQDTPACRELTVEEGTRPYSLMHVLQNVATGAVGDWGEGRDRSIILAILRRSIY